MLDCCKLLKAFVRRKTELCLTSIIDNKGSPRFSRNVKLTIIVVVRQRIITTFDMSCKLFGTRCTVAHMSIMILFGRVLDSLTHIRRNLFELQRSAEFVAIIQTCTRNLKPSSNLRQPAFVNTNFSFDQISSNETKYSIDVLRTTSIIFGLPEISLVSPSYYG